MVVRHDTDLYDLTIKSRGRTEVIHTTSNHLSGPRAGKWIPAAKLRRGEPLKPGNGTTALADGGTTPKIRGRTPLGVVAVVGGGAGSVAGDEPLETDGESAAPRRLLALRQLVARSAAARFCRGG
jgi:hypothetical protein